MSDDLSKSAQDAQSVANMVLLAEAVYGPERAAPAIEKKLPEVRESFARQAPAVPAEAPKAVAAPSAPLQSTGQNTGQGRDFTAYHQAGDAFKDTVKAFKEGDMDAATLMRDEFLNRMDVLDAQNPAQFAAASEDFMNRLGALEKGLSTKDPAFADKAAFLESAQEGLTHIAQAPQPDPIGDIIAASVKNDFKP